MSIQQLLDFVDNQDVSSVLASVDEESLWLLAEMIAAEEELQF